jgi:branched-chain amino acid aminotransferase
MSALTQLIKVDENWVPSQKGSSLYIRPFMVSTDEFLGVRIAETYRFAIICSPVGQYYSEPLKVKVERTFSRVAEGGSGNAKAAGNYAAAMYPTKLAQDAGFHQLLWTDAATHSFIEESGTMNIMFLIDDTVVTPAVGGTILKGVTRNSVLALAKDRGMKVDERRVSVEEIVTAAKDGRLKEAFGAGTAATIAPIAVIHCDGVDYHLPSSETRTFAPSILKELTEIRTGETADRFGWMVQV